MNQQVLNVRLVNNAVLGTTEDSVGAHTVIGLLKQLYEKLRTSTGNTSINIGIIQGAIRALENTVNGSTETTPPIEGLTTKVAGINTQINGITSDITGINSNISTINSDITALKSRATSIEEVNQQQTVKINDNEDDISALTTRVNTIDNSNDGRLTVVERSVANLVSEVEGQGGALDDIIDLQADVSNLQTDVGTLQQTVNNLPPGGVGQSTNQTGGERFNLYESNRNAASGDYSHAEGYLTNASGNYAHVEGSSNLASGESSHAEGSSCTASGTKSHAEGYGARATESYSHAEGYYTVAGGVHSHAEGYRSQATATAAHAEGGAYDNSASYGARGTYSHVEGYSCLASASQAHAEGDHCKATGTSSHAEGFTCTAGAVYAHAAGEFTYADSRALTVVGINNTRTTGNENKYTRLFVVGNGSGSGSSSRSDVFVVNYDGSVIINSTRSETNPSLIIGNNNGAAGASSLAQGEDTHAFGNYSFASGLGTWASSKCQTAVGKYNTTEPLGQDIVSRLFVVGNGNADNDRSDAFTVYNSGEFGHNDVKMFMGDITLNVNYSSSDHVITTFAVAYMTSNYKYCYIPNITICVKFQGSFNINSVTVNGKTFKALDPSKNRGGGVGIACADYQLNNIIYNCTLTHSGSTYYYLKWWNTYQSSNHNFADHYWNISLYNCIFQDPTQYES